MHRQPPPITTRAPARLIQWLQLVLCPVYTRGGARSTTSAGVSLRNGMVGLHGGRFDMTTNNEVSENKLRVANSDIQLDGGKLTAHAEGRFEFDGRDVSISDADVSAEVSANDANITLDSLKMRIDGYLKSKLVHSL